MIPKPTHPVRPCGDLTVGTTCAVCEFTNLPGHLRRSHRGFVRVVDPAGGRPLCTLCAGSLLAAGGEWGRFEVSLLVGVTVDQVVAR